MAGDIEPAKVRKAERPPEPMRGSENKNGAPEGSDIEPARVRKAERPPEPMRGPKNKNGAPDRIRTCGLCLRRAALYPAELRVHDGETPGTGLYSRMARASIPKA